MREALRGLTTRGRLFLFGGVTALASGLVASEQSVIRFSAFMAILPLLAAALISRHRYRLALVRTVNPVVISAGQSAEVTLTLTNEGRVPGAVMLLEEQVPYALGSRRRFTLGAIGAGWRRQVTYRVHSQLRGRYDLGPMSVRLTDPLGLVELGRAFRATSPIIVTPRATPLPPIALGGAAAGTGDNRPRAFAVGSAEDVTVREYRRGDDLRRVHWRSSARVGDLMVRREEQPWQSRATVFIDNRAHAHRGQGPSSSFEAAVSAAASVAVHLSQRGFMVRLVTATGEQEATAWHVRDANTNARPLLESLAVLPLTPRPLIECNWLNEVGHSGVVFALFGSLTAADGLALRRMPQAAGTALAIVLDVDSWQRPVNKPEPGASRGFGAKTLGASGLGVSGLGALGWRATILAASDGLEARWLELGRAASAGAVPAQSSTPQGRAVW